MNTKESGPKNNPYLNLGRKELETLLVLNGYVCIKNRFRFGGIQYGAGPSVWLALKEALGHQMATEYAASLEDPCGAKLSGWLPLDVACLDETVPFIETQWLEDEEGETLVWLYRAKS